MKRLPFLTFGLVTLLVFVFGIFGTSLVFAVTSVTIRGNLYNVIPGPHLVPIKSQPVTVVCGTVTKNATTDSSGLYSITISEAGCNPFSVVTTKSNYNASIITRQVNVSSEGRATVDLIF